MEQQPPREVRQPNTSIPIDKPSPISDAVENIRPDSQSHVYTAHDSATAIQVSPEIASAEPQESSGHSYDNVTNQPLDGFDLHNGQTSINIANMVYVDDMIQPILPAQGFTPFNEKNHENPGNMVVDDMLQPILSVQDYGFTHQQTSNNVNMGNVAVQPILPAQGFTLFTEQNHENPRNMVVDDMLQPILPTHVCEPPEGQTQTTMANLVGIRDISRPTLPQVSTLPDSRSHTMETAELHDMFQSTTPVQAPGPMDRQEPIIHGGLWPKATASQNTHNQNLFYSPQTVPAV